MLLVPDSPYWGAPLKSNRNYLEAELGFPPSPPSPTPRPTQEPPEPRLPPDRRDPKIPSPDPDPELPGVPEPADSGVPYLPITYLSLRSIRLFTFSLFTGVNFVANLRFA